MRQRTSAITVISCLVTAAGDADGSGADGDGASCTSPMSMAGTHSQPSFSLVQGSHGAHTAGYGRSDGVVP